MTTPTPDAGVRPARPQDAAEVGAVHSSAWRATYAALLPQRAAAAIEPEALAQSWAQAITAAPSAQHRVYVATAGPVVVGFVAIAPSADADAGPGADAELVTLLVAPDAQGRGHGSRLLNASVDILRENGFSSVRTWVPEPDEPRQAFLAAAGFAPDGATRVLDPADDGATSVREVRMSAAIPAER